MTTKKVILSSFGFNCNFIQGTYFHRMPPVNFQSFGPGFVPDYPLFFLFDQFIIDKACLETIRNESMFRTYASLLNALDEVGRLETYDFTKTISYYQSDIEETVRYDLNNIKEWIKPFSDLIEEWRKLTSMGIDYFQQLRRTRPLTEEEEELEDIFFYWSSGMVPINGHTLDNLRNWDRIKEKYKKEAQRVLGAYLRQVTSTLRLAHDLNGAIHDWADIIPLYRKKLRLSARIDYREEEEKQQIQHLFTIMFPNFEPKSERELVKALNDPRLDDLRNLVQDAVKGEIEFDLEFANKTLREILKAKDNADSKKQLMGWIAKPLGFIPGFDIPITIAEEAANRWIDGQSQKNKEWFFLVSEIAR